MSAASRSIPARASWQRPSLEACLSPEPLKISCQVPELIFKTMVFTSSKESPASGDSSRRAPDSVAANVQLVVSGCAAAERDKISRLHYRPPFMMGNRDILSLSRSEEHTSELQSQSNLVCRLLLEKKKIINTRIL